MPSDLDDNGFLLVPAVLARGEQESLAAAVGEPALAGRRGMLADPRVAAIARSPQLLDLVRPHVGPDPKPVRAIAFDKSPAANWLVAWHQDLTIAVRERRDVPGFGAWSEKDGVPHVHAPVEVLQHVLAVRLHLDAVDDSNGALRVLPGTHRLGRLSTDAVERQRREVAETACVAAAGDALLMRPLLLHASSRSTSPRRRRVIHIEYAGCSLPGGLQWRAGG